MGEHKVDLRKFITPEYTAWVSRCIIEGTDQTEGFEVVLVPRNGASPKTYFTNDRGLSFRRATDIMQMPGRGIELGQRVEDPKIVSSLQRELSNWKQASGYSEKRVQICQVCGGLRSLFDSLPQTPTLLHLQTVGSIEQKALSVADNRVQEVNEELISLLDRLRTADAGDGGKILSPERFESFLAESQYRP